MFRHLGSKLLMTKVYETFKTGLLRVLKQADFSTVGKQQALKEHPWRAGQTKFQTGERKHRIFYYTVDHGQVSPFTICYSKVKLTEIQDDLFNKEQQRKQVPNTSFQV